MATKSRIFETELWNLAEGAGPCTTRTIAQFVVNAFLYRDNLSAKRAAVSLETHAETLERLGRETNSTPVADPFHRRFIFTAHDTNNSISNEDLNGLLGDTARILAWRCHFVQPNIAPV